MLASLIRGRPPLISFHCVMCPLVSPTPTPVLPQPRLSLKKTDLSSVALFLHLEKYTIRFSSSAGSYLVLVLITLTEHHDLSPVLGVLLVHCFSGPQTGTSIPMQRNVMGI